MPSHPWTPQIEVARRAAGRILRASEAGVVTLRDGHRPLLVEAVCAGYMSRQDRRDLAELWYLYGPAILDAQAAGRWVDKNRGIRGTDADLDQHARDRAT